MKSFSSRRRQLGYTLLEVLMSVGLGSLILASGAKFMMERVDDVKDQSTAQYQTLFTQAAERYLRNNFTAVAGGLTQNGAPTAITLTTIRNAGFAHSGLTATNPYGQTPCLVVRRLSDNAAGARLEALVTSEGGLSIPDKRVPFVAAQSGSVGGFVPPTAPTTAQGAYGVWQTSITPYTSTSCSGTPVSANRLASGLFFDVSSISGGVNPDDVLYRNVVSGRPDLNRMNTNLDMGAYSISNAMNITASGTISGGTVMATGPGGYAQTYLQQWGLSGNGTIFIEPAAGNNLALTDSWSKTGMLDIQFGRTENKYGHTQFSRTGMNECCGDAGTIGLAEATSTSGREAGLSFNNSGNSEGNLVLANTAVRGGSRRLFAFDNQSAKMGIEATGDMSTYGGNFVTSNSVYTNILYDYYNNSFYVQPRGTTRLNNLTMPDGSAINGEWRLHIQAAETLYLQPWANSQGSWVYIGGGGGSGNVNLNDAWVRSRGRYLSDLLPNWVHKGTFYVNHGAGVTKPTCNNGGSPRILVWLKRTDTPAPSLLLPDTLQGTSIRSLAYDYGGWWGIEIGTYYYYGNGGVGFWAGSGLAAIYCWYP